MRIKENVLGRMEQTFYFIKNNYRLIVGFCIINVVIYTLSLFLLKYRINNFSYIPNFILDGNNIKIYIEILVSMLCGIIIQIGLLIGAIHYIKEAYYENNPSFGLSIQYGINKVLSSFVTYYHIFIYVYIIPLSLLIMGMLLILGAEMGKSSTQSIGTIITVISLILLIIFAIYRGTRAEFAIYNAVDKDSFDKKNFDEAVESTNENLLRIIGNLLIIGITVSFSTSMILQFIQALDPTMYNIQRITEGFFSANINEKMQPSEIFDKIVTPSNIRSFLNIIFSFNLSGIASVILGSFTAIYTTSFRYLFFKRLEYEAEQVIELNSTKNACNINKVVDL